MSRLHTLSQCHFICDTGRTPPQDCKGCMFSHMDSLGRSPCNIAYKNLVCNKATIQAQAQRLE